MLNKINQYQLLSLSKGLIRINAQLNIAELTRLYARHPKKKEESVAFLGGFNVSIMLLIIKPGRTNIDV